MNILGISAFYHDSATALVRDGEIIAAAQEERFTRKKHDSQFPTNAVDYCLEAGEIAIEQLGYVVFYEKLLVNPTFAVGWYLQHKQGGFSRTKISKQTKENLEDAGRT